MHTLERNCSSECLLVAITLFVCSYTPTFGHCYEIGTQVWSHFCLQDNYIIENVQAGFTQLLLRLFNYSYIARLEHLELKSLEERIITNVRMFLFKIIYGHVDVDFDKYFSFNNNNFNSRGFPKKLNVTEK